MKSLDNISEDLFNKIRGRFPSVTIGDKDGKITTDPLSARFFDFDFTQGGSTLGKVSVSVSEEKVSITYSDDLVENADEVTKNQWYDFLREIRMFAKKRLLQFDTRNITKSNLDKRDYAFLAQQQGGDTMMSESKLYGTSRISYQDIGNARLNIRHSQAVNPERRTQYVERIYVESPEGERFLYPYRHLNGARAMARHISEGGKPFDDFGKHITGLSEELAKLRKFKTYMGRSSVMAESLAEYVDAVSERIEGVKNEIARIQKPTYYAEAVEGFEAPVLEDVPADVAENWIDQLTIKQFNEELKDVFPYVYKVVSEYTKAKELGPDEIEEGVWDTIKQGAQSAANAVLGDPEEEARQLDLLKRVLNANGYDRQRISRLEHGCLNDPRVCLYNEIMKKNLETGDMDQEVANIGDELNSGWTTRSGTVDEDAIESAFDSLMGQFSDKVTNESQEPQIPLSEFILSLFDRENGQFPKGETAVLTAVEKGYGEQFINPAKAFIERIQETYMTFAERDYSSDGNRHRVKSVTGNNTTDRNGKVSQSAFRQSQELDLDTGKEVQNDRYTQDGEVTGSVASIVDPATNQADIVTKGNRYQADADSGRSIRDIERSVAAMQNDQPEIDDHEEDPDNIRPNKNATSEDNSVFDDMRRLAGL